MRTLPVLLFGLALTVGWSAEQNPAPASNPEQAKPEEAKTAAAAKEPEAKPPAEGEKAQPEKPFRADFEVGVRVNDGVRGNLDAYRSIVNLGEGVRLMNWDIGLDSGPLTGVEKAHFRGSGWGGDPSAWLQGGAEHSKYYRATVDHRSTAYFNAMPSFANPLLDRGILFNQRSFDTHRDFTEAQLELFPTRRAVPYFGYMRDRGFGRGVSNFVSDANEYPVLTNLSDLTNLIRGGVRMQFRRWHATLEQGGILFRDDQNLSTADRNTGNRTTPVFGQNLFLSNLLQAYEVEGSSIYSKGLMTGQPTSWLDLSGAFQFSQPRNDIVYRQLNQGRFVDLESLLFFNSQNVRLLGAANQPHVTANAGAELRPFGRFRVMQSWLTDRLHNASALADTLVVDRLEWNYSQSQTEALFDLTRRLTLRGGYRYTWGDGLGRASFLGPTPLERGQLKRHSGLAGVSYRITDRISMNADTEITRSDRVLYRTSLVDYERVRLRGRYQILQNLQLYGNFQYLNNSNPPQRNAFEFRSQQVGMGFQWMPNGGKTMQVLGEYNRSAIRSDLQFYIPQSLQLDRSFYRDNAHTITGLLTWKMAAGWTWQPQLSFGGSMFVSSGSRPTDFYQPVARLAAPLFAHVDLVGEYRWYQVSQAFYRFEGFRSHQGLIGIRIH